MLITSGVLVCVLLDTGWTVAMPSGNGEAGGKARTIDTPCMTLSTRPTKPGLATVMICSKHHLSTEDLDEHAKLSVDPVNENTGHTFLFYRDTATSQDIQDTIEPNLRSTELPTERLTKEILSTVKSDRAGIAALVIHPSGAAAVYSVHEILRDDERTLQFRGTLATRLTATVQNNASIQKNE